MKRRAKPELCAHGIQCLLSSHPEIKKLKKKHHPDSHGNKVWKTSWMLMDYLVNNGTLSNGIALDIGCGWGLSGIFLSKRFNADVTGVDIDSAVLPYLKLHAAVNQTKIKFINKSYDQLRIAHLSGFDLMVGTDICFWDELIDPLRKLINRAKRAGLKQIFIADPGRPTFDEMAEPFLKRHQSKIIDWEIDSPVYISGKILKIDFRKD